MEHQAQPTAEDEMSHTQAHIQIFCITAFGGFPSGIPIPSDVLINNKPGLQPEAEKTHHVEGAEAAAPAEQQRRAPKRVPRLAEKRKLLAVRELHLGPVADLQSKFALSLLAAGPMLPPCRTTSQQVPVTPRHVARPQPPSWPSCPSFSAMFIERACTQGPERQFAQLPQSLVLCRSAPARAAP